MHVVCAACLDLCLYLTVKYLYSGPPSVRIKEHRELLGYKGVTRKMYKLLSGNSQHHIY